MLPYVRERWDAIAAQLDRLGFRRAELDPRGYRRGGLLGASSPPEP
jgi:hypothetical protein